MPPKPKKKRPAKPKRTVCRRKSRPAGDVPVPAAPDVPHWLSADGCWIKMPEDMRQMVSRILTPAYRRFVLDAPGELERSVGMTMVHLMWLELCGQVQLGMVVADPKSLEAILGNPEDMIDRHLRLTMTKCQTAELLLKLQMVKGMLQHPSFSGGPCFPPIQTQDPATPPRHAIQPPPASLLAQVDDGPENGKSRIC
ncbi:MAG: hypothetical protein KKA28_02455 [Planctomycetes bacterium]|nr:hypothetical protein [Planctomycetota bacterium]